MHMSSRGNRTLFGTTAVAAAATLALAGCGSSNSAAPASATISGSAIARAADISGAAKGEKVAYTLTEQLPSVGKMTISGTGSFNTSPEQGQMSFNVAIPGAATLGAGAASILSNLQATLVIDNKVIYVKLPSALAAKLAAFTGSKPWLSIDLTKLASSSSIPGLSTLLNGQGSPTDPAAELKQLEAASSDGVTKVGSVTVNGVATTEYKATLNLAKLSTQLPANEQKLLKGQLAAAAQHFGATKIPYTVDIDSANLVRRLTLNFNDLKLRGVSAPTTLEMNFLAYGKQPAPTVPPAADTFSLNGLIGSLGAHTLGG